jgi:hypothetical protein
MYVMQTKLTLRMKAERIRAAKAEAARRGKSVSQMVSDFFDGLTPRRPPAGAVIPPITASLVGLLKGRGISEADYRKHLREKHS